MQSSMFRNGLLGAVMASVVMVSTIVPVRAADSGGYDKLLAQRASAIVTIKYVLKVKSPGGEQEAETEVTGVMIDPKGLVLCSNTPLGGFVSMISRMRPQMAGKISATPTDLKILIGDDTEGIKAKLLARDTELDLAWIEITDPGKRKFDAVDFSKGVAPKTGHRMLSIRRMDKYFDRLTVVGEGRIGGVTTKPRTLYVPSDSLAGGLGLTIFTPDGRPVGLTVLQMPDGDDSGGNPLTKMQNLMKGLILPAADVVQATARARAGADAEEEEEP